MRIAFGWSSIDIRRWDSKNELLEYISQFGNQLLVGESAEQEAEFYSAALIREFGNAEARPLVIGICSEGHGVTPQLLPMPSSGLCLFGVNSEVYGVSVDAFRVQFHVKLRSLFRSMVPVPEAGLILIFHEIGAKAIQVDGSELWDFSRDVLESARIEGSTVHFEFMDSEPATVDALSGRELIQVGRR